jgi:hypothetical protein
MLKPALAVVAASALAARGHSPLPAAPRQSLPPAAEPLSSGLGCRTWASSGR